MASTPADRPRSFGKRIAAVPPRVWAALVLLALGVAFIAQNRQSVRIRWLTISVTSPLWTALLTVMVIGMLIGLLVRRRSSHRG